MAEASRDARALAHGLSHLGLRLVGASASSRATVERELATHTHLLLPPPSPSFPLLPLPSPSFPLLPPAAPSRCAHVRTGRGTGRRHGPGHGPEEGV